MNFNRRENAGEPGGRIFQHAVQHHKDIVDGLGSQLLLQQQLPGEVVDQAAGDAQREAAPQLRLDVPAQCRLTFNVGSLLHLRLAQPQPFVAVEGEAAAGIGGRKSRAGGQSGLEFRHLFLGLPVGLAVAEPVSDLAGKLMALDIPGLPAAVLPFKYVFSL